MIIRNITTILWDDERKRWVTDHVASIAHLDENIVTGTHTTLGTK